MLARRSSRWIAWPGYLWLAADVLPARDAGRPGDPAAGAAPDWARAPQCRRRGGPSGAGDPSRRACDGRAADHAGPAPRHRRAPAPDPGPAGCFARPGDRAWPPGSPSVATTVGTASARRWARRALDRVTDPAGQAAAPAGRLPDRAGLRHPPRARCSAARTPSAIVDMINGLDADMVAVVGDLVDGTRRRTGHGRRAAAPTCESRHGSFFVTGNHEYFSGYEEWIAEVDVARRAGAAATSGSRSTGSTWPASTT